MTSERAGLGWSSLRYLFLIAALVLFILAALSIHPSLLAWGLACLAAERLF